MLTRRVVHLVLLISTVSAGWAASEEVEAPQHRRFDDPQHWAQRWDSPDRHKWQNSRAVFRVLGLNEGDWVADIGAGTGYFTRLLALEVGDSGKVYAVDIEPAMLEYLAAREPRADNVVTVLAEPDDPRLPETGLDLALVVNTWHHIGNRVAYIKKLARSLDPRGRIVIIDWREGELPMGPPPEMKLGREQITEEFKKAGWYLSTESTALRYQYFMIFRRR